MNLEINRTCTLHDYMRGCEHTDAYLVCVCCVVCLSFMTEAPEISSKLTYFLMIVCDTCDLCVKCDAWCVLWEDASDDWIKCGKGKTSSPGASCCRERHPVRLVIFNIPVDSYFICGIIYIYKFERNSKVFMAKNDAKINLPLSLLRINYDLFWFEHRIQTRKALIMLLS